MSLPMKYSLRRSALYIPAVNSRALEKARSLPADMLLFDLEDSIAPQRKNEARKSIINVFKDGGYGNREIVLRINGKDTPFWNGDLSILGQCKPHAVLLPKIYTSEDVINASNEVINSTGNNQVEIWLMMETPACIVNAGSIAACTVKIPNIKGFIIGTNDLAKDTMATAGHGRLHFIPWLMQIVAAAKAFNLDVIDGVFNNIGDSEGFLAEATQGRELGMNGKSLIHPKQIGPANSVFSPTHEEIIQSKKIIEAFKAESSTHKGVITVEGKMVERLHLEIAESIVTRAKTIKEKADS